MRKLIIVLLALLASTQFLNAQTNYSSRPEIGKPFTDFVLDSLENYSKKTLSYSDFKGKWVILDFWSETCSGCINSFPHVNALQKKYNDKVQFILVTHTQKDPKTAISLFKKLKEKFGLTMPVTFDQTFWKRIGAQFLPTQIIINPKGIVEAICYAISESDLTNLFLGKKPELERSYLKNERSPIDSYNAKVSIIRDTGSNMPSYLYKSIITERDKNKPFNATIIRRNRVEFLNRSLDDLYRYAFFGNDGWMPSDSLYGKYAWLLKLEVKDSSLFMRDFSLEKKHGFCYSLQFFSDVYTDSSFDVTTMADKLRFQKIMQDDLERCFGYRAKIETRKLPYYRLIASSDAEQNIRTKGGTLKNEYINENAQTGFVGVNIPVKRLIERIFSANGKLKETMPPIINETGIEGNIDITIDAIYFDDWLKELRRNGLDLVLGEREMRVIVIRDN